MGRKDPDPFEPVEVKHQGELVEREKAVLFAMSAVPGGQIWLPKSQIRERGEGFILVPRWLAQKRDLRFWPRPDLWPDRFKEDPRQARVANRGGGLR